ncbi:MAG TPA: efflux RND transporter periplasmic adaptor subunit [Oculatellaceae cyanobacterium]
MEVPLVGKVKRPLAWAFGVMAAIVIVASIGTYILINRSSPKIDINQLTVAVKSATITVRITASGTVIPFQSVNLSPKTSGRLAKLFVEQGDRVQQGQEIARMENSEIQAQLLQSRANLQQAEARLAGAQRGRPEEVAQAAARLAQVQAILAQAQNGSRPEEVAQAEARLSQAQAVLAQAGANRPRQIEQGEAQVTAAKSRANLAQQRLKRYQDLRQQGAIAQDKLDEVEAEYSTAQANTAEAQRRLDQVINSTRQEIRQREAAVTEAQLALSQLQKGTRYEEIAQRAADVAQARAALQQAQNGQRKEDVAQLRAAVDGARAQFLEAQARLQDTIIRAPFAGTVTQKYATEGAFVTPTTSASSTASATSTSIVAIAKDLEIRAKVPEVDIGQIQPGQMVEIIADAYPDQTFKGLVRLVSPEAVLEQNVTSFEVRITLQTGTQQLKSGMNVNVTFLGKQLPQAMLVPTVAIVTEKGQTGVLVPDAKNQPQFRSVTIGASIQDQTQILQGIQEGDRVFIDPPKGYKPQSEKK